MKVTNKTANTMVIGGAVIAAGATGTVEDWETVKDSYAVKQFLKAEAITADADKDVTEKPLTKDQVIAALKELGQDVDARKSVGDLTKQLDEAKAKAKA